MPPFRFKQFSVAQDQCAMKVGTDGVLLGAWVSLNPAQTSILDIGTGTGLIALMLAQRTETAKITGIEISDTAATQASSNFENSPWEHRLKLISGDFRKFSQKNNEKYDLIVSNPPFFHHPNPNMFKKDREIARFTSTLSFENLVTGVNNLLSSKGSFAVILPFQEEKQFITSTLKQQLYLQRRTRIRGNKASKTRRSLLQFGRENTPLEETVLTLEISRHQYTPAYRALTEDFYLKM